MPFVIALLCILCIVVEVILLTIMRLDKQRFHAKRLWPLLDSGISEWMLCAAEAAKIQTDSSLQLQLIEAINAFRQNPDPFRKNVAVNTASRLCTALRTHPISKQPPLSLLLKKQDELEASMYTAIGYYNAAIRTMNNTLSRPIAGLVGRLLKFIPAELLFQECQ